MNMCYYQGGSFMKKNIFKTFLFGNIYCALFLIIGLIFKMPVIKIANGLFYSMAIYIIVGLIALLNPKKTLNESKDEEKASSSLKDRLFKGNDLVSQGYRVFLYCFEICIIIIIYSYFVYEVGAKNL